MLQLLLIFEPQRRQLPPAWCCAASFCARGVGWLHSVRGHFSSMLDASGCFETLPLPFFGVLNAKLVMGSLWDADGFQETLRRPCTANHTVLLRIESQSTLCGPLTLPFLPLIRKRVACCQLVCPLFVGCSLLKLPSRFWILCQWRGAFGMGVVHKDCHGLFLLLIDL